MPYLDWKYEMMNKILITSTPNGTSNIFYKMAEGTNIRFLSHEMENKHYFKHITHFQTYQNNDEMIRDAKLKNAHKTAITWLEV